MTLPPQRIRAATRAGLAVSLTLALLALPTGCESLRPDHHPEPTARSAPVTDSAAPAPVPPATLPGKHATRRGYYVFYHDFEWDQSDPLFADLETLPDQVFGELRLPPTNTIVQVFLFDTQDRYERYMRTRYKDLPPRRAYFLQEEGFAAGRDDLKVLTWMGDHIHTDLRHELTHALLHGVLKDVPLWLDEGLASYFELPPGSFGVNPQHIDVLRRGLFRPDLARLEKLEKVKQMEKPEYREAWAWVHLMLRGDPATRRVLHDYLQALRTNPNPGPLLPRLREALPEPEQALVEHLARVEYPRPRAR
jgi:hypothetical protein